MVTRMIRDTLFLAFAGSAVSLLGTLAFAGGLPFYPYFLLLHSLAFVFVALVVYAGKQQVRLLPQTLYKVATLVASGGMLVCLAWVMKNSLGEIIPLSFLIFLATVLLPYLITNAGAYWLITKKKL